MLNRSNPNGPPSLMLTKIELALLDQAVPDNAPPLHKTLSYYLNKSPNSAATSRVPAIRLPATWSCGGE